MSYPGSDRLSGGLLAPLVQVVAGASLCLVACNGNAGDAGPKQLANQPTAADEPVDQTPSNPAKSEKLQAHPTPAVAFVRDDMPAAMDQATREHKAVFVDAWAPWCHTCLSMHHYVFTDPSLTPLQERVVFAAVDTDRPENAEFVAAHRMSMWPTMFVLDPEDGTVIGLWPGAASAREVRTFLEQSLTVLDARRAKTLPKDSPIFSLVAARTALAAGDPKTAGEHFEQVVAAPGVTESERSEALVGQLAAFRQTKRYKDCLQVGRDNLETVTGVARPVDFALTVASCAEKVSGLKQQREIRGLVIDRLRQLVLKPHPDASIDDRADALSGLASVLEREGQRSEAKKLHEQRIAMLEQAAAEAPSPEVAATYDYGRVISYLALRRHDAAVTMLTARTAEFPDNYEPHARLASVLHKQKKWGPALTAVNRALELSYGPRRQRYLKLKASIQAEQGDIQGQLKTLEAEVHGWKKLVAGEANKAAYEAARKRFEAAVVKSKQTSSSIPTPAAG